MGWPDLPKLALDTCSTERTESMFLDQVTTRFLVGTSAITISGAFFARNNLES